jgi:hypothetical protein
MFGISHNTTIAIALTKSSHFKSKGQFKYLSEKWAIHYSLSCIAIWKSGEKWNFGVFQMLGLVVSGGPLKMITTIESSRGKRRRAVCNFHPHRAISRRKSNSLAGALKNKGRLQLVKRVIFVIARAADSPLQNAHTLACHVVTFVIILL